ncbi:MAG: 2-hydroxyacid dehydrogenase [Mesorhizobium sp.]|uniref:2-hydroxyacid dehydrogenase n=1 Tax=Mesorhizobium sp. TaxID=1871066 RepID=UPI0012010012|nr:2-hydroxyacid dehydrogenase [Mesorhizobium sp.]TIS60339.1 MAG: 2-hydroxyacid dehydrogenase [Mesorhizobium sp.]TIS91413.1 MAG: 2-hydroxyacid dehydrogenase [Mesorhizobium sp.]TJW13959.1 MAG: 2-hydroxyacid dehydrogenase [Mesorhizobium sp.]TJW48194.1 MAG: 2-hydroxyacid dehydrogenase [Mesorhizobium sp.]
MTNAEQQAVAILVPGQFNDHAVGRIDRTFSRVWIERADPSLVSDDMRKAVRGIAAFGGISAALIDALPHLEIIANFGVGYDSVDARHAAQRGIMVTNTPDVLTEEVADTALGLLINTVRDLPRAETWLRDGSWMRHGNYHLSRLTLRGRRAGIFGMGRIGRAIARRLEAFGLPIAYHNRHQVEDLPYEYHGTLKGLAEAVDTLISVAPGGASTEKAVNAEILSALGPNGVFVNIGRGSTVDEAALAAALANGTIAAAGLDVFADEPNVPPALLAAPNTSLLPHVGSASEHTRRAMADLCVDNLVSWFSERKALTPVPETADVKARA